MGGDKLENLYEKDILRSKEEKRVLTSNIYGIEDEYYKLKNEYIPCVVIRYGEIKVLIPITHLGLKKESKASLRGLIGAEIDFIVMEYDEISNIAIGSRIDAMKIRRELEIPKLKENQNVKVRIVAVGIKNIIVDMYGKEVTINASELQHTYILNCKEIYKVGDYLKVKIKKIDIANDKYVLSAKACLTNPFDELKKYITINGEYVATVIAFPKNKSGVLVQLDNPKVTSICRIPARFNDYPHYMDKVLIKVTEIKVEKKHIYSFLVRVI